MRKCPNGHDVGDDVKYCPQCGAEIQEKVAEDIRFCKKCGQERKGAEKFCSHCGTPFCGNPIVNSDSSNAAGETAHGSSSNKVLMYLLIIVPILLIGGYFVNNHIQEEKRLEKARIEENERSAEEERKRIEEENKPANRFYNFAKTNEYVWEGEGPWGKYYPWISGGRGLLFFYPFNKSSGRVSFVRYGDGILYYNSGTGVYNVNDESLSFIIKAGNFKRNVDISFSMRIENEGNSVKLILWEERSKLEQRYNQIRKPISDPFNK